MRALLRKMEHSTDFAEVFAVYERDMSRIAQEIRRLRDENLELNEKYQLFMIVVMFCKYHYL